MKFSLAWLLWLVTCSAIACWLLMLPAIFNEQIHSLMITVGSSGASDSTSVMTEVRPTHWPLEVAARVAFCVLLAIAPAIIVWRRNRHREAVESINSASDDV